MTIRTVETQLRWVRATSRKFRLDLPLPSLCELYEEMAEFFKPRWRYATAAELMAVAGSGKRRQRAA
jgi:hypothetical protein